MNSLEALRKALRALPQLNEDHRHRLLEEVAKTARDDNELEIMTRPFHAEINARRHREEQTGEEKARDTHSRRG